MDENQTHDMKTTIEEAVVNRLKELFSDDELGKEMIQNIRNRVLAQGVNLEDIKKSFNMEDEQSND